MVEYAQLGAIWFSASGGEFCVILSKGLKLGLYCGLGGDVLRPFQSNPIMVQTYCFWTSKRPQNPVTTTSKIRIVSIFVPGSGLLVSATIPITQSHSYNSSPSSFFPSLMPVPSTHFQSLSASFCPLSCSHTSPSLAPSLSVRLYVSLLRSLSVIQVHNVCCPSCPVCTVSLCSVKRG